MTTSLDPATDSITDWLRKSENRQDPNSFDVLWRNFGLRLVRLARIHLRGKRDPAYGSDDLALSAFCQACNRLEQGFLDNLSNSKDLWKLLVKITKQKSINLGISIQNRKDRLVSIPLQASASILDLRVDRRKATVDELGLIAEETAWQIGRAHV